MVLADGEDVPEPGAVHEAGYAGHSDALAGEFQYGGACFACRFAVECGDVRGAGHSSGYRSVRDHDTLRPLAGCCLYGGSLARSEQAGLGPG